MTRARRRRRAHPDVARRARPLSLVGLIVTAGAGIVLVPVSLVPPFARAASAALADAGVTSDRTSLSNFAGNVPIGGPSQASVGVEGAFTGLPAIPRVVEADPVALDLIGYGPVQMTGPALRAITGGGRPIGTIADQTTISGATFVNPVIRALFATRPSGAPAAMKRAVVLLPEAASNARTGATAYVATSTAPTDGMNMVCPIGQLAVVGGGSTTASGAALVTSTPTDQTGAALDAPGSSHGWAITFSQPGTVTLWLVCR